MMEAILDIKKWGNSLGVRLPAAIARAARLHIAQRVHLSVENGAIVIRPEEEIDVTLDERLSRFDPVRHGGETMQTQAVELNGIKWGQTTFFPPPGTKSTKTQRGFV
ncbi:MAG: AbrB/MazE/SpoVT family DNA-binding domain-containing protein [Desulfobacteraceae bacterium]|nr:AbrB/MazE/SpoVT family DNA-binding domain-containing protein [Desulfobacteraceae bacterium]